MKIRYRCSRILLCISGFLFAACVSAQGVNAADGEKIEEIIVSAKQRSKNMTEINPETEALFSIAGAASDPLQAIYALPGVTFSGDGEPVIWGSAPQDNAYYIDLVPAQYLFHVFGNSIFDKNVIQKFDLYPGAFPSQFNNATGGVIDVSLRNPRNQPLTSRFNLSLLSSGVMFESGITENQAFYLSYRRSLLDNFYSEDEEDEDDGVEVNKFPVAQDYQFKYVWNLNERNTISVVAAGASDIAEADIKGNANEALRDPDFAGPINYDEGFDSQGIAWDWQSEDGRKQLKTRLSHSGEFIDLLFGKNQSQLIENNRIILRTDYSQQWLEDHRLTLGVGSERNSYDVDINAKIVSCSDFDPDCGTVGAELIRYKRSLDVNTQSAYLQDEFSFAQDHTLSIGVHYSGDDYLNESRIEPRIRWDYRINDRTATYLALGQYSQLPELDQIIDELGNPNLKTVKADHVALGIERQLDNNWSWKADLYYKSLSDVVINVANPLAPDFDRNYTNDAEGEAYGVNLQVSKKLTDKWSGWLALSVGKTERTNLRTGESAPFNYDKPIMADLVVNYQLSERWTLGAKWSLQSGDLYTPIIRLAPSADRSAAAEPIYGKYNSERFADYQRLDFRAEYTSPKAWGYWKFFIDILNVSGQENINSYEYAPNSVDVVNEPPAGFGADVPVSAESDIGFFPSIGFEIQF